MRQITEPALAPELETIAQIADERLRGEVNESGSDKGSEQSGRHLVELQEALVRSATAAIAVGMPLGAVAEAERIGQARARRELGGELLRRVERTARRCRDAREEYEQTVARADRLGLSHRDIATAARVAAATVRAIAAGGTDDARDLPVSALISDQISDPDQHHDP